MPKDQRKQRVNGKQNCQKMDKSLVENQDTESKIKKGRDSKVIPEDQENPSSSGLRAKRQRKVKRYHDFVYPLLKRKAYYVRKKSSNPDKNKPLQPIDLQLHQKVSMTESCAKDHNGHPSGKLPEKSYSSVYPEIMECSIRIVKTFVTAKDVNKTFEKLQVVKVKKTKEQTSTMELKEEPKHTQKKTEKKKKYHLKNLMFSKKFRQSVRENKTSKKNGKKEQKTKKTRKHKPHHIKKQAQKKLNGNPINKSSSSDILNNAETNDLQSDSRKPDATNTRPRKRSHASQCSVNHPETSSMSEVPVLETQDNSAKKMKTLTEEGVADKTRNTDDTSKPVKWTMKTTPKMTKEKKKDTPRMIEVNFTALNVDDFLREEFTKKLVIKNPLKFPNKNQLIEPTTFNKRQLLSLFVDERIFYMNKEFTGVDIHMAEENEINRILNN